MPLSGCISLRTCITGINCSSISCAVNGSVVGSCSLKSVSMSAPSPFPIAPYSMKEFYGFSPVIISFCDIPASSVGVIGVGGRVERANCIYANPALIAGQCYNATISYKVSAIDAPPLSFACAILYCQGVGVQSACASSTSCITTTFSPVVIKEGEDWFVLSVAHSTDVSSIYCARVCTTIFEVSPIVGSYSIGTPFTCDICTGFNL